MLTMINTIDMKQIQKAQELKLIDCKKSKMEEDVSFKGGMYNVEEEHLN